MRACRFMLIAGEPSGDQLASELVASIRRAAPGRDIEPTFVAAGGELLARAGAELLVDLTRHSVIGLWEALRKYPEFRRIFDDLMQRALELRPDVVVGVDYGGFNLRFAKALRRRTRGTDWNPRIVQFVSPQVWASRAGRARVFEEVHDLLLGILPFEKDWYARHAPRARFRFVGHPLVDRHGGTAPKPSDIPGPRRIVLLPGSRTGELERHLPVLLRALEHIRAGHPVEARLVLPNESLATRARVIARREGLDGPTPEVGGLSEALCGATLALASTGTVTLECAWHGVPTIALYRTSWSTHAIGKRLIQVKYLAMPNLLADAPVMPEFIQDAATPDAIGDAALRWLRDPDALRANRAALEKTVGSLGPPGACDRAAALILDLIAPDSPA